MYGKNLKRRGDISDSKYIFDMALEDGGERFCTLAYNAGAGNGETVLSIYNIASSQSGEKLESLSINGEFPIGCSFLDNGRIAVLTNVSVRIYDKNCNQIERNTFYGSSIRAFSVNTYGVSVVIGSESQKNVISFDKKGDLVYNSPIEENVSSIILEGKYLFLRTSDGVIRIDVNNEESEFLTSENGKMLVYNENTAMVCGDARAEYLVFGKKQ